MFVVIMFYSNLCYGNNFDFVGFTPIYGITRQPSGWVQFCHDYNNKCNFKDESPIIFNLTSEKEKELIEINNFYNHSIIPITDMNHYGVIQHWSIPNDNKGSCHHYMLSKREALIKAGWPRSSLLITVVMNNKGEGHAVLTVKTNKGDFILDNLTDEIKPWNKTGYFLLKRHSVYSDNVYEALSPIFSRK